MFGSSNRTIIQTQTSKTTQKWVTNGAQNQASTMAIPVLDEWGEQWGEQKRSNNMELVI